MKTRFYSSVEEAMFMRRLRGELEKLGWPSEQVYGVSKERYRGGAGRVQRMGVRWSMYPGFGLRLLREGVLGAKADISVVTTNPFFAPAVGATVLGRRDSQVVQLLWDLFPDALVEAGLIGRSSLSARFLSGCTRRALERCEATVFLGEHLRKYAEETYGPSQRGVVIPVGADGSPFADAEPVMEERLEVLYSGNFGWMHDTVAIAGALRQLRGSEVPLSVSFRGTGQGISKMREFCTEGAMVVRVGGGLPDAEWIGVMKDSSVALVTMKDGAERVVMPSKTYSALVAGQAILAVCPERSDLADLVRRHDCGWIVKPGDGEGLAALLEHLSRSPELVLAKRLNAFAAGHGFYDMGKLATAWDELFKELKG